MKLLFQDKVVEKLKIIPSFVWFILLAASEFFASAYATIVETEYSLSMTAEYLSSLSQEGGELINVDALTVMSCVFSALFSALICEFLFRIVYAFIRRYTNGTQSDFCFRIRLVVILSDLILGCIGILYFFFPSLTNLLTSIFEAAVPILLLFWFYEDYRERFVDKKNQARVFLTAGGIILVIYFVLGVYGLLETLLLNSTSSLTPITLASIILSPSIVLVLGVGAYFNSVRLKKISAQSEEEVVPIQEEKPKNDTIFKDFGF